MSRALTNPALLLVLLLNVGLLVPLAIVMGLHWASLSRGSAASLLAFGGACWFLWRRRGELRTVEPPAAPARGVALLGVAVLLYVASARLDVRFGTGLFGLSALAVQVYLFRGGRAIRAAAYPLALLVLALPLPGVLLGALSRALLDLVLVVTPALLRPFVGPVSTEGYYILLPGGELPVIEDCSGVGAILLFVPLVAILARTGGSGSGRSVLSLLVAGLFFAFAGNLARVLVSAILVTAGSELATSAAAHEAIGAICLLLSLLGLVAFHSWRRRKA